MALCGDGLSRGETRQMRFALSWNYPFGVSTGLIANNLAVPDMRGAANLENYYATQWVDSAASGDRRSRTLGDAGNLDVAFRDSLFDSSCRPKSLMP